MDVWVWCGVFPRVRVYMGFKEAHETWVYMTRFMEKGGGSVKCLYLRSGTGGVG